MTEHDVGEGPMFIQAEHDKRTMEEVQQRDIYRVKQLKESGFEPKLVVDIGAHIGTFTRMAAKYWPASHIFSFEPELKYFRMLGMNLPDNATAIRGAVLGNLHHETVSTKYGNADDIEWRKQPTGHFSVLQLMSMIGNPIEFLKIDCEGCEVETLREMEALGVLKAIPYVHGEWHFEFARKEVERILSKTHTVEFGPADNWDGFWAKKK